MRTQPIPRPIRARSPLLRLLPVMVFALGASSCGSDGGGTGPGHIIAVELEGSGRGTVIGSNSQLNCSNVDGPAAQEDCEDEVREGTQVTLAASPAPGSTFAGWSGDDLNCPGSAPCSVIVNEARTITATFDAPTTQVLTVTGGGAGTGSGSVVSDPAGIDCTITAGVEAETGCSAAFPAGTSVQLVETGNLVAWGGACSGSTCSVVMSEARTVIATFAADAEATQLAFVGQPSAVQTGAAITPPVQVEIRDENGQRVAGRSDAITLALAANPGSATLGGELTRNAVNGVATFSDLTLDQVGAGYTLTASAAGLEAATSTPFNVEATPVAQLAFSVQPSTTAAGSPITPAIQVEIRDQGGVLLTDRTDEITIALQANPGGATLGGTPTAAAVAGVATFSNITLNNAATGYTFSASAQAASGAVSQQFAIVAGAARLVVKNSLDPQEAPVNTAVPVRPSVKVTDAFNNPVAGVPVVWEVTSGDGTVVASNEDPVTRPTGPLGLSTAVSWTLGPDVGSNNNTLRATVTTAGVSGGPITFTASGTLPPNRGIFTGTLKETNNSGQLLSPIADATLTFVRLEPSESEVGTAQSEDDGSFVSPPIPAGVPYRIRIDSEVYKTIEYAKPELPASTLSVGNLGMVRDDPDGGQSDLGFTIRLDPEPAEPITVRVEMYIGYYLPETEPDESLAKAFEDFSVLSGDGISLHAEEWGVMTLRVSTPGNGYEPVTQQVFFDQPNETWGLDDITLRQE